MLFYIWKNLWQDKLRFFFSIAGVTLAIILITIIQGFLWGIYKQLASYPTNSGGDLWVAQENVGNLMMTYSVVPSTVKTNLLKVSEIEEVAGIYYYPAIFTFNDMKSPINVIGYDTNKELGRPWSILDGKLLKEFPLFRYIASNDINQTAVFREQLKDGEVILDKAFVDSYNLQIGDRVEILDRDFEIVGVSDGTASWISAPVFVSKEEAARMLGVPEGQFYNFMLVKLKPDQNKDLIKQKILNRIPDIEVWKTEKLVNNDRVLLDDLFLGPIMLMTMIAFVIGILIIGLIIYTTTLQKIREYGILKAIGAKNSQLYKIIISQTFIISFIGYILGMGISLYLHYLTNNIVNTKFMIVVNQTNLIIIFIATIIMSILASYLPARRVFYIEPDSVFKS